MKTLKKIFYVTLIFLAFVSCKKDQSDPELEENARTEITAKELAEYYIVSEDKVAQNATKGLLTLFYFRISGENVNVTRDAAGGSRLISRVRFSDNEFRFETISQHYSFKMIRAENGQLRLTEYSRQDNNNTHAGIIHAEIYKKSDAPVFLDKTFKDIDGPQSYLKVTTDEKYKWNDSPNFGTFDKTYVKLQNFGWKGNGADYYGAIVKNWRNYNHPVMLMHSEQGNVLRIFKEF